MLALEAENPGFTTVLIVNPPLVKGLDESVRQMHENINE